MMAGSEVFKYAVKALDSVVDETLAANGLDKTDLDWLIPHQANLRIIEATAKRLQMSDGQCHRHRGSARQYVLRARCRWRWTRRFAAAR